MSRRWTRPLLLAPAAVYLPGMGFFLGAAFERRRFDGASLLWALADALDREPEGRVSGPA